MFRHPVDLSGVPRLPNSILRPLWTEMGRTDAMPSDPFGNENADVVARAFALNGICLAASRAVWLMVGGSEVSQLHIVKSELDRVPGANTSPMIGHYWLEDGAGTRYDPTWEQAAVWPEFISRGVRVRGLMAERFGSRTFSYLGLSWRCSRLEFDLATRAMYEWRTMPEQNP